MPDEIQPPWGQFDYEAWHDSWAVQAMSWKEAGLYFQLLALQWKHGAIPADPKMCGRMLGVGSSGPEFEDFERAFEVVVGQFGPVENDPSKLRNARQAKERDRAIQKIKQKIAAGKASGKSRRSNKKEQPLNDRSNTRSTSAATQDVDVDKEGGSVSSLRSETAASGDVGDSLEDGLKWNTRLAPLAREAGGEKKVADWLKRAKPNPDEYERILIGLVSLRERGALAPTVKPGEPVSPAVLVLKSEGQPIEKLAIAEYWRLGRMPKRNGTMDRLTVGGTGPQHYRAERSVR